MHLICATLQAIVVEEQRLITNFCRGVEVWSFARSFVRELRGWSSVRSSTKSLLNTLREL